MTIRIPPDLPSLRKIATEAPGSDAVVVFETEPGHIADEFELFVEAVLAPEESEYFEIRTTGPEPAGPPATTLSFEQVLDRFEALGWPPGAKEVFWVSGLIPVASEAGPRLAKYAIRRALPIIGIITDHDAQRVAFVAEGLPSRPA